MPERLVEKNSKNFRKYAAGAVRSGLVAGVAVAGTLGFVANVEGPKRDDGDVAASRFVMTPPGAKKWVEPNPFLEALSLEVQRNLFKMGEKLKIEWYEEKSPVAVIIPKLGVQSLLIPTERIPDPDKPGKTTLETPNFGIAVPREMIKNGRKTNVFIYGHRQWAGVKQRFGDLTQLSYGDTATIVGSDGEFSEFEVVQFKLIDYAEDNAIKVDPEQSVTTFQTTAMEGGVWIINSEELAGKVEMPTETSGHMALQVVLEPVEK